MLLSYTSHLSSSPQKYLQGFLSQNFQNSKFRVLIVEMTLTISNGFSFQTLDSLWALHFHQGRIQLYHHPGQLEDAAKHLLPNIHDSSVAAYTAALEPRVL